MAAVSRQHQHSRLKSSSDPFTDPKPRQKQSKPPPPPPKAAQSTRMPAAVPKSAPASRDTSANDITEAVRDTVTLKDPASRAKPSRTHTTVPAPPAASSRPSGRRSQSEDSANIVEKPRSNGKPRSKKGSQHADVIDRLDFTGVGPMFHHDGPFDACAPSRNKHRNKAPMYAWGTDSAGGAPQYGDSAYPSAQAYKAFSNDYPEPPKKKVDAIAEAWGIHEPEPFEEFFAGGGSARPDGDTPASSIYNGMDSHSARSNNASRRPKETRESRDEKARMVARRSGVPPPQPIFTGEAADMEAPTGSPPATSPGFPKRSKSLMHRIRKMRDAPNIPIGYDYDQPPSPTSPTGHPRPTHRPQNSFLGRFGGGTKVNQAPATAEPFVLIETNQNNKELPPPPRNAEITPPGDYPSTGYFDGGSGSPPSGDDLGRKTSLMKKVGKVVRGTK